MALIVLGLNPVALDVILDIHSASLGNCPDCKFSEYSALLKAMTSTGIERKNSLEDHHCSLHDMCC